MAASARRIVRTGGAVVLLSLLALGWATALALSLWFSLEEGAQQLLAGPLRGNFGLVMLFVLVLPLLMWVIVRPWVARWPRAAERLREEVAIVSGPHAGHRVTVAGAREMRELAGAIDSLAQSHSALRQEVALRIAEANAALAAETRRLAALMSELTVGVLVCHRDGRILLYNARAAALLGASERSVVGLGRDVGGLLDAGALEHAWQQVLRRLDQQGQGSGHAVAHVVTARREPSGGALLRVQMVPTLDDAGSAAGYLLLIDDITRAVDEGSRRDALLQRLTEGTRSALANLRAAAQTLQSHPELDTDRRRRFIGVVHEEAERLAGQLDAALREPAGPPAAGWPLESVQAGDLAFALQRSVRSGPGVECRFDGGGSGCWLEVDSHAIVQLMSHLVGRLAGDLGVREVRLEVRPEPRMVRLDIVWRGEPLDATRLKDWESTPLGGVGMGANARELLDETPLPQLNYTVFDTETTGLRPSEGDEIIAIGAVRIVNAKLLDDERFDRRVKPSRPVRASALAVHGITTESLAAEPPLEEVLPPFARFCEGTVLVAHNAAFDMRFLELARDRTGLRFDQPVLDTMLLAAVVQPAHRADEHHLEQIAGRLGVQSAARHEALGDAITTARVFVKLLPLLAERGITTLGQARAASMRTAQAGEKF